MKSVSSWIEAVLVNFFVTEIFINEAIIPVTQIIKGCLDPRGNCFHQLQFLVKIVEHVSTALIFQLKHGSRRIVVQDVGHGNLGSGLTGNLMIIFMIIFYVRIFCLDSKPSDGNIFFENIFVPVLLY